MISLPSLENLPLPPLGKTGWPWTEQPNLLLGTMSNGKECPRITVVTPNYNYGCFLEETIRSVLLQGYPNLQYIIIDGGSTDNSVEIIRKYETWIDYWVSEPDDGQASAINKALNYADGKIFNWINSDDILCAGALYQIAQNFGQADLLAGGCCHFEDRNPDNFRVLMNQNLTISVFIALKQIMVYNQPAVWLLTEKIKECGGWDSKFQYVFDWDLMFRYLSRYPNVQYIDNTLVNFRWHSASKTVSSQLIRDHFLDETILSLKKYSQLPEFNSLQSQLKLKIRQLEWRRWLYETRYDTTRPAWKRRFEIFTAILEDPSIRFSKNTFGTLRRSFYPNFAKTEGDIFNP